MDILGIENLVQSLQDIVRALNELLNDATGGGNGGSGSLVFQTAPYRVAGSPANAQVSVGTTATQIIASGAYNFVSVQNTSTVVIFIGAAGVTTSTGYAIPPGATFTTGQTVFGGPLYGVVATGTATMAVLSW